ncbi:MAG: arsenate reductase ArsC [Bacteroidota bacterium]
MKILILCTGNSCRSQMAHAYMKSFDSRLMVRSAGTHPAQEVNPKAVKVMKDEDIDISNHKPEVVNKYLDENWDYVITVCDDANETCPFFPGEVKHRLHMGFEDPSHATGTDEFIWNEFIRVRNEIKEAFKKLYTEEIKPKL